MATDKGTKTVTVATKERAWRINIEAPMGAEPLTTVWHEEVSVAPDGSVILREQAGNSPRSYSEVADELQPFTPATPGQISGAELAALISARADMWRLEDAANEVARLEAMAAAQAALRSAAAGPESEPA